MKFISDQIIKPTDIELHYDDVELEIPLIDSDQTKEIRFIFYDKSDVVIRYGLNFTKIIDKRVGVAPIRQPY